ncbi:MAG: hypothetical protein JNK72_07160 [Myxococcales bacterium]|nr:hypothetical protein [Myxococcales bacterium]
MRGVARGLLVAATWSVIGCTEVDLGALNRDTPQDSGAALDAGPVPVDDGPAPLDNGLPPIDNGPPPIDNGPPPVDVPAPIDSGPPPVDAPAPIDSGPPPVDTPTPTDRGNCMTCNPSDTTPRFCAGTGAGACQAVYTCENACGGCAAPPASQGDRCNTAPVITAERGRTVRTVLSTCGAQDNLSIGCGRTGPDIAVGVRVQQRGRVRGTFTVPPSASINFGYGGRNENCINETSVRPCNDATLRSTQSFDLVLEPGVYYLYVVTNTGSTIVFDVEQSN